MHCSGFSANTFRTKPKRKIKTQRKNNKCRKKKIEGKHNGLLKPLCALPFVCSFV